MTEREAQISFDRARVQAILTLIERMAAGDTTAQLPLSEKRDELDAIAYAVNVLSDELRWASARMAEAERHRFNALLKGKESPRPAPPSKSQGLEACDRSELAVSMARAKQQGHV